MYRPFRIDGGGVTLVLTAAPHGPLLAYAGAGLPAGSDLEAIATAVESGPRENRPDDGADRLTLLPQAGWGFGGAPAVELDAPSRFELLGVRSSGGSARFLFNDPLLELNLELHWRFEDSGLLTSTAALTNEGSNSIEVRWLASLSLPLPPWATIAHEVGGRWADEFRIARIPLRTGRVEKASHGGRTGFDGAAYAIVGDETVGEERGRTWAAQLAWSGSARHFTETLADGARQLQIGERLGARDVVLAPGATHRTPPALVAFSTEGLNGVRRRFHSEARRRSPAAGARRVHFNSWEAVYFDLSEAGLLELADEAGELGAERFVLDDGWFLGRRTDRAGLGDWSVDPEVFPNGLDPLIRRIHAHGMDFGLWIEPEMISPDSQLARLHPDWCLHVEGRPRPTQRRQLALDLSRADVRDHLVKVLGHLLRDHDVAYLKWDHNRELFPVAGGRAQCLGFYDLLDRLREAHPNVEIESCASGGGRIDFGVLSRASRVWASDNTDAIERLRLHRGLSLFVPPETIGAHVGASPNPITGRRSSMAFRARVALFAHMGVEADPRRMPDAERETLRVHVDLYKRHRELLHSGEQVQLDTDDPGISAQIVIAPDGGRALALLARVDQAAYATSPPVRLSGLDPKASYRVTLPEPWPDRAARHLAVPEWWMARPVLSGAALGQAGLRLPLVHPETAWLIHLERIDD